MPRPPTRSSPKRSRSGQWERHLGHSDSLFVNASTWGLMLTGRVVKLREDTRRQPVRRPEAPRRALGRAGHPPGDAPGREAARRPVRARPHDPARRIARAKDYEEQRLPLLLRHAGRGGANAEATPTLLRALSWRPSRPSARRPARSAPCISDALMHAARHLGEALGAAPALRARQGGAPRRRAAAAPADAGPRRALARAGAHHRCRGAGPARSDAGASSPRPSPTPRSTTGTGLGIAVQAYGKRAIPALRWLRRLAERAGKRIPVRLVKGAYWDSEIKWAQERGLADYPVFTRKLHTDVSYLACVRLLLSDPKAFYPQFATHNALRHRRGARRGRRRRRSSSSACTAWARRSTTRCVGERQARAAVPHLRAGRRPRGSARLSRAPPAGERRQHLVRQPAGRRRGAGRRDHPRSRRNGRGGTRRHGRAAARLPRPRDIYLPERANSARPGADRAVGARELLDADAATRSTTSSRPARSSAAVASDGRRFRQPRHLPARPARAHRHRARRDAGASRRRDRHARVAGRRMLGQAGRRRAAPHPGARRRSVRARPGAPDGGDRARGRQDAGGRAGRRARGRRLPALLRSARRARLFAGPVVLPGPTGETQHADAATAAAPFACISPWNFPLAIFTGQVAAALAAGNAVLAKPAEQTPITAFLADAAAARSRRAARRPASACRAADVVGAALVKDPRVKGVAFTGSNETGWAIQKALADRRGAIVPFIAETGGLNAMIADSSALPEQVVRDVVRSAFDSAGQRCSAARVLFVQEDVADRTIDMLAGAIAGARCRRSLRLRDRHRPGDRRGRAGRARRRTRSACSARARSWST